MQKLLRILICLLVSQYGTSQTLKSFSSDPSIFIEEMQKFLEETNEDIGRDVISEFKVIWSADFVNSKEEEVIYKSANSALGRRMKSLPDAAYEPYGPNTGKLSDEQQEAVIKTANTMLKKRMKAIPDFKNYLYTLLTIVRSNQSEVSFNEWQISLDKLLQKSARSFTKFINTCDKLFAQNAIYLSTTTKWISSSEDYTFDFDSLPKIVFPNLTLKCYAKGDSSVIINTKGVYYPSKGIWYGSEGRVNWTRAGISEDSVYADLKVYKINMDGSDYTADSVLFYNKKYFSQPLIGKLSERISVNTTQENANYPRFESYNVYMEIKQLAEGIDYKGGFSMQGSRIIGSGNKNEDAHLIFYKENVPFITTSSKYFSIRPEKIISDKTSILMQLDQDSIFHPGLQLKFIFKERELALIRNDQGIAKSPYFNSFHDIDMYFDALYWKIDEPVLEMKMISASEESKANFESSSYYKDYKYNKIQGIAEISPLAIIWRYIEEYKTREIYTSDLAQYMKLQFSQVKSLLISLANQGFLLYDLDDDKIVVKDRLYHYINAKIGKTDYDVLQFESVISSKSNASLNLLNYDLTIDGISRIFLSDSQNVFIIPADQQIILKKNRDFQFSGLVRAGRFDFFGKDFGFDYDNFKITLNNVDSLRLKVPGEKRDEYGRYPLVNIQSVIQNVSGDLYIDQAFNKSGLVNYPNYPIFKSTKKSSVFYDNPKIHGGIYTRDKMSFALDTFTVDSLDNFSAVGLAFKGTFYSEGMFPQFDETLKIQNDYSLGFIRSTPPEGYPVYKDKGTYTSLIKLSNRGLRGDGILNYLSSTTKSIDFIFYPDSMNTLAQEFEIRKEILKGVGFPSVKARDVYVHWTPYEDKMNIQKRVVPIGFYDNIAQFSGSLELTPIELTGSGIMSFSESELEARLFNFKQNSFGSDTSAFRLSSDNAAVLAFSTVNVKSNIDLIANTGEFKSNGGGAYVNFPVNQYICYIDQFKWFMDKKEIELIASSNASGNMNFLGSEFISTHPQQDSLRFFAPYAKYDLSKYIIKTEKVKEIFVADARIFPDNGQVTIEKNAKIQTLNNANVEANTTTKFHVIYNATIDIQGRNFYSGKGDYDYVDETGKKQIVKFTNINVDTTFQTIAQGEISDSVNFTIHPKILFKGTVMLLASKQFLKYNGYGKLLLACNLIDKDWFKFTANINPSKLFIPIDGAKDESGNQLTTAMLYTSDSAHVYSAFLNKKKNYSDKELLRAEGYLTFDSGTNQYIISTLNKLQNNKLVGNYLSLDDINCVINSEGKIDYGLDLGQVKLNTVGNLIQNLKDQDNDMEVMMTLDFFFAEEAYKNMADNLLSIPTIPPTEDNTPFYEKNLAELIGQEKADKLISELGLYGSFKKTPDDLEHSFYFSNIKLKWDTATKSFVSYGPIGIGVIGKQQVNRQVQGYIELVKKRSGDIINIYLEIDEFNWYFFNYQRGIMQTISSNESFNSIIKDLKPEKRTRKVKDDSPYQFIISTERKKKDFLKRVNPQSE